MHRGIYIYNQHDKLLNDNVVAMIKSLNMNRMLRVLIVEENNNKFKQKKKKWAFLKPSLTKR